MTKPALVVQQFPHQRAKTTYFFPAEPRTGHYYVVFCQRGPIARRFESIECVDADLRSDHFLSANHTVPLSISFSGGSQGSSEWSGFTMGMVVSAAISGIPMIEALETPYNPSSENNNKPDQSSNKSTNLQVHAPSAPPPPPPPDYNLSLIHI